MWVYRDVAHATTCLFQRTAQRNSTHHTRVKTHPRQPELSAASGPAWESAKYPTEAGASAPPLTAPESVVPRARHPSSAAVPSSICSHKYRASVAITRAGPNSKNNLGKAGKREDSSDKILCMAIEGAEIMRPTISTPNDCNASSVGTIRNQHCVQFRRQKVSLSAASPPEINLPSKSSGDIAFPSKPAPRERSRLR